MGGVVGGLQVLNTGLFVGGYVFVVGVLGLFNCGRWLWCLLLLD